MFRQFAKERQAWAKILANNAQLYNLSITSTAFTVRDRAAF
jgi:hypothetical protein